MTEAMSHYADTIRDALYLAVQPPNTKLAPVAGTPIGDAHLALDALLAENQRLLDAQADVANSAHRMLRHGQDFWERHQHSPDSDEMSAALTDLYFALKRNGLDTE